MFFSGQDLKNSTNDEELQVIWKTGSELTLIQCSKMFDNHPKEQMHCIN